MKRALLPSLLAAACVLTVPSFAQEQVPSVPTSATSPTTQAPSATANGANKPGAPQASGGTLAAPAAQNGGQQGSQPGAADLPVTPASMAAATRGARRQKSKDKNEKIQQTRDARKAEAKARSAAALVGVDSRLPDKQLYDKAVVAMNKGHFDVARLDLQTMLNTYPDSQYQMRAKLAIADSWYKEGGTAALTQAESEYADFRVFFPNAPEAAEAQMRIGDIYFRQMDRPDRDYAKATHAEEEYRRMLTDYPDSVLVPQAKQRLREVQEVLASREADIASFYATRGNVAAEIARYETVVDTYPLYSHMDDVLIGLGDAYEVEAKFYRSRLDLPEGGRAKLEKTYDDLAADQYRKVVLEHSATAHVEDAKDRLVAMNLPIPEPTKEQIAASQELENSRATYKLKNRVELLFLHKPDTVLAAGVMEPTLTDPKADEAPTVVRQFVADFTKAFAPAAKAADAPVTGTVAPPVDGVAAPSATAAPAVAAAPLQLNDVAPAEGETGAPVVTLAPAAGSGRVPASSGVGIEVIPSAASKPVPTGMEAVGGNTTPAMAPVEAPAEAPDQVNAVAGKSTPAAQVVAPGTKVKQPEFDKADESSSKHKPKKGIKKVIPPNPF